MFCPIKRVLKRYTDTASSCNCPCCLHEQHQRAEHLRESKISFLTPSWILIIVSVHNNNRNSNSNHNDAICCPGFCNIRVWNAKTNRTSSSDTFSPLLGTNKDPNICGIILIWIFMIILTVQLLFSVPGDININKECGAFQNWFLTFLKQILNRT